MLRRLAKLLAPLTLLAVVLGIAAGSAGAGSGGGAGLVVRSVDSTDPNATAATVLYTGSEADLDGATVTENGQAVDVDSVTPFDTSTTQSVALIFEISAAMDDSGALVAAKDAAREWVTGLPAGSGPRISIVTASDNASLVLDYTTNRERILDALERVAPAPTENGRKKTALFSAVRMAAQGLTEEPGPGTLVVMSAQGDNVGSDAVAASGAVASANAVTMLLEYTGGGGSSRLSSLVSNHGGVVLSTGEGTGMAQLVEQASGIVTDGQAQISWSSTLEPGGVADVTIQVGDQSQSVAYVVGDMTAGKQALTLKRTTESGGVGFLQTWLGLGLTVLGVLIAVGGLAFVLASLAVPDDQLASALQAYSEPYAGAMGDEDEEGGSSLAKTAFIQRAVEITEQVAADRGMLTRAENLLERANLPLRAGEALFFYGAVVVILTIVALALSGSVILGLIVGVVVSLIPITVVKFLATQRKKKFMSQLPDTLQLLSGTLRAGYSLMQGVEAVSQEVEDPMGLELRRVVTESRLGRPLEEALEGTAERMDSPDFSWAVMAIRIQREVGGNLSELLMTVSETMVARERLRRDVRTLTAEGRMSAIVLGGLPPGLGLVMYVLNPDYISTLFSETLGHFLIGAAVISMLVGFAWMRKIINIEI